MRNRLNIPAFLALAAMLLAAGCDRGDTLSLSSETDEPLYRQGQQLSKQGRNQEALNAYLKVIAKRDETAPESHLEVGLILLRHVKDPIAAIYHFRKYLELQPNSRQAVYVRGLIDTSKREFARTLPATPLESQADQLEKQDQIDRLLRENDQLKAEIASLRGGVATPPIRSRATLENDGAAGCADDHDSNDTRRADRNGTGGRRCLAGDVCARGGDAGGGSATRAGGSDRAHAARNETRSQQTHSTQGVRGQRPNPHRREGRHAVQHRAEVLQQPGQVA